MKLSTINVRFVFNFKSARFSFGKLAEFKIAVMRKGKNSQTKLYKLNPETSSTVQINQTIQFLTTLEYDDQKSSYVRKTASLQVLLKDIQQKQYLNSSELQLLDYLNNQPTKRSIRITGQMQSILLDFQVNAIFSHPKNNLKSMTNIKDKLQTIINEQPIKKIDPKQFQSVAFINNQIERKNDQIKSSKLITKKKQKTLKLLTEKEIDLSPTQKQMYYTPDFAKTNDIKKQKTTILKNPLIETKLIENKRQKTGQKKGSDCSIQVKDQIQIQRNPSKKKSVKILEDQTSSYTYKVENYQDSQKILKTNQYKNQCKILSDQIKQLQKELYEANQQIDKQKRNEKQLQQKISRLEKSEKSTEQGKQTIIKKLYQQISQKNNQIKELREQCQKQNKKWREQEQCNQKLKQQIAEIKLQKDKITLQSKYTLKKQLNHKDNKENIYRMEIEKIKKEYEEEISELKEEIEKKNKLLTRIDSQNSMIQYDDQVCYSKKCDSQKRQLNNKFKQYKKNLEDVQKKLESKQKLIKNYEALNQDRQKQNLKQKQQEKWKGERMILQQKIEELNLRQHQLYQKPAIEQKKLQQELQNCKLERDNIMKELQRNKINLNRITKDKQDIQAEIIKSKQRVMDILNAVQEHGGMKLFDQISNHIL